MTIRERQERDEEARLSPYAALSSRSAGRAHPISTCDLRTCYQRDRDRIIHCKSFRRLKYKTQVFLTPMGDHYRTRLTHTLEVSQVARTLARSLRLNEDLTEAAALGHDLGHTPFGHIGESTLNRLLPGGFRHNEQSLRVAERLETTVRGSTCAGKRWTASSTIPGRTSPRRWRAGACAAPIASPTSTTTSTTPSAAAFSSPSSCRAGASACWARRMANASTP